MRCKHTTLRIKAINIAERCPDCRMFVTRDGKSYREAQKAYDHAQIINYPSQDGADLRGLTEAQLMGC